MDPHRVGWALRAVRVERGRTQQELARRAGVSDSTISRIERGRIEGVTFGTLTRVARLLEVRLDLLVQWHGGDLARLLNRRHSLLHESVARWFARQTGWRIAPEVSFSVWGERGAIDVLGWHESTRSLLVIELKTEIVDIQDLIGSVDRKRRLAPAIGAARGWEARTASAWVVLAESSTTRRRLAAHRAVLRAAFPSDGRTIGPWIASPAGTIAALSIWPDSRDLTTIQPGRSRRRVRHGAHGTQAGTVARGPHCR